MVLVIPKQSAGDRMWGGKDRVPSTRRTGEKDQELGKKDQKTRYPTKTTYIFITSRDGKHFATNGMGGSQEPQQIN